MGRLRQLALTHFDWPIALRPRVPKPPPFRTYVIARRINRATVEALGKDDSTLHVHNLDAAPGKKFPLLADLISAHPPAADEWILICDDDIRLTRGTLSRFVAIACACGFEIAQPSHDRRGFVNFGITKSRPLTRARTTTFVEIGPLFAIAPPIRSHVVGLFRDVGMGWGMEAIWLKQGFRLGIVDDVRMRHLGRAGSAYSIAEADAERNLLMDAHGITEGQPQDVLEIVPAWYRFGRNHQLGQR